ncbi:2-amino-4-hydroxy-6-hydroxymethyldihydropteridine diphosphokinase [Thiolinea disciformis]|uniref:2-amino-4-hydroxy-6- hydroxymethyldihydropteridine diphosphokinase n=1 Tax=Thiolinea disciformis TaxID=125614 RepID=UPI000381BF88|nr:2-amino-4-hydroxy-6-hydroxymethyldihydropteridine diphosphokinase [Thiolinea disciformis]
MMVRAYIGLGSNLGDSLSTLQAALNRLHQHANISLHKTSSFYRSKPVGPQDQPDYINAVAELETDLSAVHLLKVLLAVEQDYGRVREAGLRWGPRTLDLDLLLYGNETIDLPQLRVPHPFLTEREFVLIPLLEIAPDLCLPQGERLSDLPVATAPHQLQKL